MQTSIKTRLTAIFIGLALGPPIVIGLLLIWLNQEFNIITQNFVYQSRTLGIVSVIITIVILAIVLAIANILSLSITRQINQQIETLVTDIQITDSIKSTQQTQVTTKNKLSTTNNTFNDIKSELQNIINTLENRIQALEVSAEISRSLSEILDLEELLEYVVISIKNAFNYYYVHIYLIDEKTGELIIGEGIGTVGQQLKTEGHKLQPGQGIVGHVASSGQPFLAENVDAVPFFFRNPKLAKTQSELAVPLRKGNVILGVLDMQSVELAAFNKKDLILMQSIAAQVAVAVDNARLFQQTQQRAAELVKAREIAETANKAKTKFLANMSHEFRTPLNGILGYAQILKRDTNLTKRQANGLYIIQQSGQHLLTLINDILDLSKIEASKMDLRPTEFNLPNFLQSIATICQLQAEQKDITFTYQALTPLPTGIEADEKRLRQVLLNLLSNAIKFTDQGYVTFKVKVISPITTTKTNNTQKKELSRFYFEITDTGVGINPEHQKRLFLPFEQVGDTERRDEGTGLGLAISQKLVQIMGSTIHVKSKPKQGSTFWLELDLPVVVTNIKTSLEPEENIIGYKGPRQKILIVDDKEYNRAVLFSLLEPLGFEVFEAVNGKQGLIMTQEIQPDVILMDLVMPVMMGLESTTKIREIPAFKNTIIIAISAGAFEKDREKSIQAGCDEFLPKPIEITDLLNLLKSFLKLEWLYETKKSEKSSIALSTNTNNSEIVPPSPEEIAILLDMALRGDMRRIQERATHLEELDQKFIPFANKLYTLAKNFEDRQIIELIKQFML